MSDPFTLILDMNGASRYSCLSCGKEFSRKFNLQRHVEMFHDEESNENARSEDEETPSESSDSSERVKETSEEYGSEMEDNEVYRDWYEEAIRDNQEPSIQKYRKYFEEEKGCTKYSVAMKLIAFFAIAALTYAYVK